METQRPIARDATPSSREKILDVAEARFAQRGYAGVGLREVAEAAGLGKSSLFHHFRSKAALYLAVLDRVIARIEERLRPALETPAPADTRLEGCIDGLVDALAEHPTTARLLLRGLFEDDDLPEDATPEAEAVQRRLDTLVQGLQGLVAEGTAQGVFRPAAPAHTLQTLIGASVYHFASGEFGEGLLGGPLFRADAVRVRKQELRSFVRRGLAADRVPSQERKP
jgi:TetR/AcrR family transcriptional regulator